MITITQLIKRFGRIRAVDGVSFTVEPGQAVALWGVNGAGKTTIIRCLLGLYRYKGSITVAGFDARRKGKAARRLVGYVPQELAFHDDMRVAHALRFFARIRRVDAARGHALLETVGLAGQEAKRVRELSGGMKQRLALALALISDPPIIILDEPTSNLDAAARADVVRTLVSLKQQGKTILFASHRAEEVAALADRILVLDKGRLTAEQTPTDFRAPRADMRVLKLLLATDAVPLAVRTLQAGGYEARANGQGLYVNVPLSAKATPIRILTQAAIDVHDFEFINDHDPHNEEVNP